MLISTWLYVYIYIKFILNIKIEYQYILYQNNKNIVKYIIIN